MAIANTKISAIERETIMNFVGNSLFTCSFEYLHKEHLINEQTITEYQLELSPRRRIFRHKLRYYQVNKLFMVHKLRQTREHIFTRIISHVLFISICFAISRIILDQLSILLPSEKSKYQNDCDQVQRCDVNKKLSNYMLSSVLFRLTKERFQLGMKSREAAVSRTQQAFVFQAYFQRNVNHESLPVTLRYGTQNKFIIYCLLFCHIKLYRTESLHNRFNWKPMTRYDLDSKRFKNA